MGDEVGPQRRPDSGRPTPAATLIATLFERELHARGVPSRDIRRTRNPSDGRSYLVVLTAAGLWTVDQGRPAIADAFSKLEPFLPRDAVSEYARYATELREALQRATVMAAAPSDSAYATLTYRQHG